VASILIIDDSAEHRSQIRRTLESSGDFEQILEADDGLRGLKMMLNEATDIVLCDLEMPGLDGEKLLRVKHQSLGDLPFLFLTGSPDQDRRAGLLELGASDVLTKPFHPPELIARLKLHLRTKRLQDELREKNETLARLSTTDPVTGLRTRRFLQDVLAIEFLRAKRYHSELSVLMADLDHFKAFNDQYGHQAGDDALKAVAEVISHSAQRPLDFAARFGGEEFALVLYGPAHEYGRELPGQIREAVRNLKIVHKQSPTDQYLTVSIGVAMVMSDAKRSMAGAIQMADEALYRAKEEGRNRVVVNAPDAHIQTGRFRASRQASG